MYTTHPHPCILSGKLAMDSNMCIECKMLCQCIQVAWTELYIGILTYAMDAHIVAILLCASPCVYEELDVWLTMKTEAYACRNIHTAHIYVLFPQAEMEMDLNEHINVLMSKYVHTYIRITLLHICVSISTTCVYISSPDQWYMPTCPLNQSLCPEHSLDGSSRQTKRYLQFVQHLKNER